MRRMKNEPMTFYPVTEYEQIDPSNDYLNFYLSEDITQIIKKSPYAITMVFDAATVSGNYSGSVYIKMLPTKPDPNYSGEMMLSYFGVIKVDEYYDLVVSCNINSNNKRAIFQISRNYNPEVTDTHFATFFKNRLVGLENIGYGIGNLINYSIEPVSDSLSVTTLEI